MTVFTSCVSKPLTGSAPPHATCLSGSSLEPLQTFSVTPRSMPDDQTQTHSVHVFAEVPQIRPHAP